MLMFCCRFLTVNSSQLQHMMPKKVFHIRIKFNILDSKAVIEEIFNSPFFIDSMVTELFVL